MPSIYRPFSTQYLYFDRRLNEMVYQMPRIFPTEQAANRVISVAGTGVRAGFTCLMVNALPCLDMVEKGQCFPLRLYERVDDGGGEGSSLLDEASAPNGYHVRDAITDAGLQHFQDAYPR